MNAIKELMNFDWETGFIFCLLLILGTKEIIGIIDWFRQRFGVKTNSDVHKDKINDRLDKLEEIVADQGKSIDKLAENVEKLSIKFTENQIDSYRFEILDMASAITSGREYTKEQLAHAISIHSKYEKILEENNMTNGQVDISIEIIRETYRNMKVE